MSIKPRKSAATLASTEPPCLEGDVSLRLLSEPSPVALTVTCNHHNCVQRTTVKIMRTPENPTLECACMQPVALGRRTQCAGRSGLKVLVPYIGHKQQVVGKAHHSIRMQAKAVAELLHYRAIVLVRPYRQQVARRILQARPGQVQLYVSHVLVMCVCCQPAVAQHARHEWPRGAVACALPRVE